MKKSKFLKKSLAMLLALMLVVAMIPLSAAAANPALSFLYINDNSVANSNGTFATEIFYEDTTVDLRIAAGALDYSDGTGSLQLYKEGTAQFQEIVSNDDPDKNEVTLSTWDTDSNDNTYTLNLRVLDKDGVKVATYTVVLTESQKYTTASLDESSGKEGTGVYDVDINNGSHDINLTVADGALEKTTSGASGINFRVRTQDNATMAQNPAAGVTVTPVPNNAGLYEVRVTSAPTAPVVTVTSESQKNTATWKINITEVGAVTAFSLGDYEGKIDGYDIYVTVPKSICHDQFGDPIDVQLPVNFTVRGNNDSIKYNNTSYQDGAKLPLGKLENPAGTYNDKDYTLLVTAAGYTDLQTYKLHVKVEDETSTALESVWINDRQATADGLTYTANLPQQDENGKATNLTQARIYIYTSASANITIPGFTRANDNLQDVDGQVRWFYGTKGHMADPVDITKGLQVVVKAENGDTQTYTLKATIEKNTDQAYIDPIYISNGTTQSKGVISGNTITFTVPYMTLGVGDWKVYATTNASADAVYNNGGSVVRNGVTTMNDLSSDFTVDDMPADGQTVKGAIWAENMNDADYFTKYDIVVKLDTASTNKTLSKFQMSIQNTAPDRNDKVTARANADNSVVALASGGTITNNTNTSGATGVITLNTPYGISTKSGKTLYKILTDIETDGGVAFYGPRGNGDYYDMNRLSDLPNNSSAFDDDNLISKYTNANDVVTTNDYYVVVLPEEVARAVLQGTSSYPYTISQAQANQGTVYRLVEKAQPASDENTMSNISVKEKKLDVQYTHDVVISGSLPWSYTAGGDAETDKATWLTFDLSAFATATVTKGSDVFFYSNGDPDGDGESAANATKENSKLLFVRAATGNGVNVYYYNGTSYVALPNNTMTVVAENGTSTKNYTFKLTYSPANTEADLKSFSIGNSTGRFDGNNVYVTVPYGSDLMGLIPTFTTSDYATVNLDSRTGEAVISGKTSLNFNQKVKLMVTSEDGKKTNPYYVYVTVSEAFSDVPSSAWYYNNVMQAAAAGIVSGYPDGTFKPGNSVTRRDFAIMLTQMLGVSNDGTAVSPFIDVDDDDYGVVSIAYCKAHNIISGYDDGTFKPDATITRQEAASMIVKAMGVSKASDELYPDDSTIAGWAKDAVYKAKAAGLMKGDAGTGNFRPTGLITRAEAASIMVNALYQ